MRKLNIGRGLLHAIATIKQAQSIDVGHGIIDGVNWGEVLGDRDTYGDLYKAVNMGNITKGISNFMLRGEPMGDIFKDSIDTRKILQHAKPEFYSKIYDAYKPTNTTEGRKYQDRLKRMSDTGIAGVLSRFTAGIPGNFDDIKKSWGAGDGYIEKLKNVWNTSPTSYKWIAGGLGGLGLLGLGSLLRWRYDDYDDDDEEDYKRRGSTYRYYRR